MRIVIEGREPGKDAVTQIELLGAAAEALVLFAEQAMHADLDGFTNPRPMNIARGAITKVLELGLE